MNRYSANNYYGINLRYPVDRDLFSAWHLFLQLGPELNIVNRVINCIPLLDSVPKRTINANLGEFHEKNGELTVPFNGPQIRQRRFVRREIDLKQSTDEKLRSRFRFSRESIKCLVQILKDDL